MEMIQNIAYTSVVFFFLVFKVLHRVIAPKQGMIHGKVLFLLFFILPFSVCSFERGIVCSVKKTIRKHQCMPYNSVY